MQASRKTAAFLLPGMLLFFGLTILLFKSPSQYSLIAPLYLLFVLATGVVVSLEMASMFAVLVTLIFLGAMSQLPSVDSAFLAAQACALWVSIVFVHRYTTREQLDERSCSEALQDRAQAMVSLNKEKEALDKRLAELHVQAALRQHLFTAVHQLASLLDPMMIRQRLMEFVRATVGKGTIHFFAGSVPRDLMDKWVMERKLSLLVTDVLQDNRFRPVKTTNEVRSVLAAPIVVERQMVGVIRLNGFEAGMFTVPDLRILEALSLMASLALENLQLLARLHEGAVHDNLTGLYTRKFFDERLNEEILRAGRYQTGFGVLLMDIDHFKRYNDTYGHAAGDQVLVRFAQTLQRLARPVDLVARYGGEEFIMILPQTTPEQIREMAEAIRRTIESDVFQFGSEPAMVERVTVSIGLSVFPQEATIASQLVRVADMRLYQAKESGRNRVIG